MTPTIVAIIMLIIIFACAFFKKIPIQLVLAIVPIICGLFLGVNINKLSGYILASINSTMQSSGYLLLFGLMYFTLLKETGMFDTIVNGFIKVTNGKMNIYIIMIMTTIIALVGGLSSSVATAYLIVFPVMLQLYKKFHFDRNAAMVITQTAICSMCFVPWSASIAYCSTFAKVDAMALSRKVIPISLCFIPVIILQWIYFAIRSKKNAVSINEVAVTEDTSMNKENPNARPKLFFINLIIFFITLLSLSIFKIPAYIVFIFASMITILINYPNPKDYKAIWTKSGAMFFNVLLILVGISVFTGVFTNTPMMKGVTKLIIAAFPSFLTRYMHLILLALSVIILRFVPYHAMASLYPVIVSVGATFGLSGVTVIAPYVTNMGFATASTTLTAATLVGTSLLDIDANDYCNKVTPIMLVSNILVIVIGMIFGVIQ